MAMNPAHAIDDEPRRPRASAQPAQALPAAARLRDYEITGLAGESDLAIVYLAWDHSLQRKVAIKEYMPASMASRVSNSSSLVVNSDQQLDAFKAGLKGFVNEARLLARFDHPSLVKVYRFWEENGTAYMVMPFYEGPTLKTALSELGHVPSEDELRAWFKPILNAVTVLHNGGIVHQNIGPDGIVLTPIGPVLLGLAAAERAIAAMNHTPAAALKPGFAAIEQYGGAAETTRGPWTDLYALAAVIYTAITGAEPEPAADRLADDRLRPLSMMAAGLYSTGFLLAVDSALAVQPELRPRDHLQFRALMGDIDAPEAPISLAPPQDLMQEPFLGGIASTREITVPDHPLLAPSEPTTKAAWTESKARAAPRGKAADSVLPRPSPRPTVSRAPAERAGRGFGKRAIYGIVAVTCALIGLATLALQFYSRQSGRLDETPASTATAAPAAVTAPPALRQPLPAAPVAPAPPTARPVDVAPVPQPSVRPDTTPAAPAASGPAPMPAAASASAPSALAPPTTALERQNRCTEILQRASLERITAAETEFFKKECK